MTSHRKPTSVRTFSISKQKKNGEKMIATSTNGIKQINSDLHTKLLKKQNPTHSSKTFIKKR
ncbi:MAG: hypothetical protein CL678_19075 [Bdellovibrionaceae bacterium]|nr:hypothetical protein [Pseudobdellovibrionaceae bacterium]